MEADPYRHPSSSTRTVPSSPAGQRAAWHTAPAYAAFTVLKDVGEAQRQAGQQCLLTKLSHSTAHNSYKLNSPGVAGGGGRKKFTAKDFLSFERKRSE